MERADRLAKALREAFLYGMECYEKSSDDACLYDPEIQAPKLLSLLDGEQEPVDRLWSPEELLRLIDELRTDEPDDAEERWTALWEIIMHTTPPKVEREPVGWICQEDENGWVCSTANLFEWFDEGEPVMCVECGQVPGNDAPRIYLHPPTADREATERELREFAHKIIRMSRMMTYSDDAVLSLIQATADAIIGKDKSDE